MEASPHPHSQLPLPLIRPTLLTSTPSFKMPPLCEDAPPTEVVHLDALDDSFVLRPHQRQVTNSIEGSDSIVPRNDGNY